MYNENQKLRFLSDCIENGVYAETTLVTVRICFNMVEEVEKFYEKDLSEFVPPEIMDMLKKVNSRSRSFLSTMCAYFFNYYEWCYKNERLVESPINPYDNSFTKRMVDEVVPIEFTINKYFTKEDVLKYIDNIKDVGNKFIAYSFYLGIRGSDYEELVNIRAEDLDREKKELKLITGRTIKVDDYFITLMEDADRSSHYFADSKPEESKYGYYEYLETGYVLKQLKRRGQMKPVTMATIANRTRVIKEQSGNRFVSVSSLYKNGLINYIIERHRESRPDITLNQIINEKINNKLYVHDLKTTDYIAEFGAGIETRVLRNELKEYLEYFSKH